MSAAPKDFPRAWDLLLLAAAHGWAVSWSPAEDTSGSPYVLVRAVNRGMPPVEHRVTWHTRRPDGTTGTPRMFSAMTHDGRWHDTTLARVRADITREAS